MNCPEESHAMAVQKCSGAEVTCHSMPKLSEALMIPPALCDRCEAANMYWPLSEVHTDFQFCTPAVVFSQPVPRSAEINTESLEIAVR